MKKTCTEALLVVLMCLHGITALAQAAIGPVQILTNDYIQFRKIEFLVPVDAAFENPYRADDLRVDMIGESPSGVPFTLPCYYVSGESPVSLWKARFAPRESGMYSYYFKVVSGNGAQHSTPPQTLEVDPGDGDGFLTIHNNWTFKFDSGKPFRGIGENVAWESRVWENENYNYENLLTKLAGQGMNYFRTWMSPWNLPLEWKTVVDTKRYTNTEEYYHPQGIARIDELVILCESLDLKIMLAFDWHGALQTGDRWNINPYNVINGGPANTPAEFFTSAVARERYKDRLRYIVARWGYSTSIGAWEFFNEIDNAAYNGTESTLAIPLAAISDWHREMSAYLKSIDPYDHIVTTSVSHRELSGLFDVPDIDVVQKHMYRNTTGIPAVINDATGRYNKPFVVGEFGYDWDWNNINNAIGSELDFDFKRGLWYGLFSPTPVLPMSWWWDFFDARGTTRYFSAVREILDDMLESGGGTFEPLVMPVIGSGVESYGVKCGEKYFVYLLNNTTEAVIDKRVRVPVAGASFYAIERFDPENGQWAEREVRELYGNRITAGWLSFSPGESVILVLTPDMGPVTSVITPEHIKTTLYPNPAKGQFNLSLEERVAAITILNMQASVVGKAENVPGGMWTGPALPPGMYTIVITHLDGRKEYYKCISIQ